MKKLEDYRTIKEEQKEKEISMKEKIDSIYDMLDNKNKKVKKLKLPRKARVGKMRMRKGWCGILFLNETNSLTGQKSKLEGGTYKTKDGNIHVTNGQEIIMWEGKFPIVFQRHDKLNPTNLFIKEGDRNEVYGQTLVKLRMKSDVISEKKKGKIGMVYIIVILVAGYFLLKTFFPAMFGG